MNRLHQWINTGLLLVCAAALVGLWLESRRPETRCVEVDQRGNCVKLWAETGALD